MIVVATCIAALLFLLSVTKRERKSWSHPRCTVYNVLETGEVVESSGCIHIIMHVSIRGPMGEAGPCLYQTISDHGLISSVCNWDVGRI